MLTKKQLVKVATCHGNRRCSECLGTENSVIEGCIVPTAKTALAYRDMLKKHVWHKRSFDGDYFCIECHYNKSIGHQKDCELAALLKEESS